MILKNNDLKTPYLSPRGLVKKKAQRNEDILDLILSTFSKIKTSSAEIHQIRHVTPQTTVLLFDSF